MKTIVHIVLTDEERNRISNSLAGKKNSKLVSRAEINQLCQDYIRNIIARGHANDKNQSSTPQRTADQETDEAVRVEPGTTGNSGVSGDLQSDADSLPSAPKLAAACRRVIEHIENSEDDDTLNIGWCASILLATGIR